MIVVDSCVLVSVRVDVRVDVLDADAHGSDWSRDQLDVWSSADR